MVVALFVDGGTAENASTLLETVFFLVGGLLGAVSVRWSQNRSLIVLTSFAGAGLVIRTLMLDPAPEAVVFCGLAALGMLLQARDWLLPAPATSRQELPSARALFED